MAFVTYILRCADDTLYTGWTVDIEARLRKHNEGKGARYTRARTPVTLERLWEFDTKPKAMQAEWHLKRLSRWQKLQLIEGQKDISEVVSED
jgi:putative endonuclease